MVFALIRPRVRLGAAAMLMFALIVHPQHLFAQYQSTEREFLLLEVRLDQSVLSNAIPAYELGEHTLLPLGALARLLTLAIKTQPGQATASGYILTEDRGFSLNLDEARVTRAGVTESFDPALALTEPDDIYIAKSLLERWLPVKLEINRSSLSLRVHALEALPLQTRLKRERLGEQAGVRGGYENPDYPHYEQPYRLLSMPFIDQTFATVLRKNDGSTQTDAQYTALLAGDLLGMESSLYLSSRKHDPTPDVRLALGRRDPGGDLLGPLRARSFQLGSISAPSADNVTRGISGEGVTLSNRPLTQPTSFDRQVFEGDLPPGWDVELYYNDALVGFQLADSEGRYRFEDQPLSYGRNEFQLIFNGPLGKTRVEQYSFPLAQSMVRPGEFQYSLTEHRDDEGQSRSVARFDLGLSRYLSASAGFIRAPADDTEKQYTTLGLRTFWQSMSISGDFIQSEDSGSLTDLGMQTRVGDVAVDASRIHLSDFASDVFPAYSDPIRTRDELRLSGSISVGERSSLPVAIEARRDERESGVANTDVSARVSAYAYGTALTNTLNWRASGDTEHTLGTLRISRRLRDMSFRSQLNYSLGAESDISALAFTANKPLGKGYRMTLGVAHTFASPQTRYTGGFTKSLGRYGLGVNASYEDTGEIALGVQLFVAMGRDPRQDDWLFDARPMANSGAASVKMFLDDNNNGVLDDHELPLSGAGFTINGGPHKARTNAAGVAHINHLPVKQYVDIGVDMSTLEDPQWSPQLPGINLVPRPGAVATLEFPVRLTTEIDGTVYLQENGVERGIGDLELELLNDQHEIVGETTSSWDGFYIVPQVVAGEYLLRVSPQQLRRLGLTDTGGHKLTVSGDGSFISGVDFIIMPGGRPSDRHSNPLNAEESARYDQTHFRTESWVQDQLSDSFTIQLMAASSEATVKQYIERHKIKHRAAYVRTSRLGLPWYSVIYGSFMNYPQARATLEQLSPTLTEAKPWVRRFDDVQAALRQ
jgi:hypothetical protein